MMLPFLHCDCLSSSTDRQVSVASAVSSDGSVAPTREPRGGDGSKMEANELESQKDAVKAEIRREMRIKDGAERLVKASKTVKYKNKSRREAAGVLKNCQDRISSLQEELKGLNSQVADHYDGAVRSSSVSSGKREVLI